MHLHRLCMPDKRSLIELLLATRFTSTFLALRGLVKIAILNEHAYLQNMYKRLSSPICTYIPPHRTLNFDYGISLIDKLSVQHSRDQMC